MTKTCRTCRYWRPFDKWDRHPENDRSAACGFVPFFGMIQTFRGPSVGGAILEALNDLNYDPDGLYEARDRILALATEWPPWVSNSYWCRHHRTAWIQLTKLYLIDWWLRTWDRLKYDNPLHHYLSARRYRRGKKEAEDGS